MDTLKNGELNSSSKEDRFLSYWKKELERKLSVVEEKGYDIDWAKRILVGKGITKGLCQLVSLDGELQMLSFLDVDTMHGERIDFLAIKKNVEVWTPMNIRPQKKLIRSINMILQTFHVEPGCLHQIVYSSWKTPSVVRYEKTYLPEGEVKLAAEILFDIEGFQKEVARLAMKEVRRKEAKFRKMGKRGIIAIDIRHLTVVDPAILSTQIHRKFTNKDADVLDGLCLMVMDPFSAESETKLIIIPNAKSLNPLSESDFPNGTCIEPFHVPYAYAFPIIVYAEAGNLRHLVARTRDGMLVMNGQKIAPSFAAETPIEIIGLMERPSGMRSVRFETDKKRMEIPFKNAQGNVRKTI